MAELHELLRAKRGGRSQASIAAALDRSQALISKWEAGLNLPALHDAPSVARVYGIGVRRVRSLIIAQLERRSS
jgi:transcriptional regulator with XRE-family HTH domain